MRPFHLLPPMLAAIVVAGLALALKGGSAAAVSAPASAGVKTGTVTLPIDNYKYLPSVVTVKVGARITWTNHDPTAHTATADSGSAFDTGALQQGQSRTIDFTKPGTYSYHCLFHAFMTGTVKVVG